MADDSKYPNSRPGLSPALGFSNTYRVHQKAGDLTLPFKKITLISEVSDSTKQSRWLSSLYPTFCLLLSFFILHISYSSLAPPTPTLVSHLLRAQCPSLAPWKAALPNSMLSLHLNLDLHTTDHQENCLFLDITSLDTYNMTSIFFPFSILFKTKGWIFLQVPHLVSHLLALINLWSSFHICVCAYSHFLHQCP